MVITFLHHVFRFHGIFPVVIQFTGQGLSGLQVDPFHVAVIIGTNGETGYGFFVIPAVSWEDTQGMVSYALFSILKHRDQALTLKVSGEWNSGKLTKRRVDIHELRERAGTFSFICHTRGADDHGNPCVIFKIGMLAPCTMVAELPTMVSPKDDNSI